MDVIRETSTQPSPALAAYAHAAQDCRDIAALTGVRDCDRDPEWRASEYEAEQRYDEARNAGHSAADVLKAGRKV
ncbi:hypothetical protein [Streptomyces sp. NPDC001492]